MNGSSGNQSQSLPKFRIVPGRQLGEPPPAAARTISRTSSWNSNSNSQDGMAVNPNRPSTSSISLDNFQNASFGNIKEEPAYYNSPSPCQPQQQHQQQQQYQIKEEANNGAVRYGHPSTSSSVVTVSVNGGTHQVQQQPVPNSMPPSSINGNVSMSMAQAPLPGQMPAHSAMSSNGVKQVHVQQVQFAPMQPESSAGLVNNSNAQQHVPGSVASSSAYQPQPVPVVAQQPAAPTPPPPQQPQQPPPNQDHSAVIKCAKFFRTLVQLSNQPDYQHSTGLVTNLVRPNYQQNAAMVKALVKEVITGSLEVEQFTSRLQNTLGSKAQPHLKPFLDKTLPALREAMRTKEMVLDGINLNQICGVTPVESLGSTFSSPESLPSTAGNSGHAVSQAGMPAGAQNNIGGMQSSQSSGHYQQSPSPHAMIQRPESAGQMQRNKNFTINGSPSPANMNMMPANAIPGSSVVLMKSEYPEPATLACLPNQTDGQAPSVSGAVPASSVPAQAQPAVSTAAAAPTEQIQTKPFTNFQMLNQYRVLQIDVLLSRIRNSMLEAIAPAQTTTNNATQSGTQLPADDHALTLLAQAAEYRLRKLLTHLSTTAEHRTEQLRSNPHYKCVGEYKKQLKFVEDVDKNEQERRENREKEALIRMSKSKGKDKETFEKAKQIQQADQLAARNRDANAAAMAALGGTRKRKIDDGEQSVAHGLVQKENNRPRTKRVVTKDLMLILSQDRHMKQSKLRTRIMFTESVKDPPL